MAIRPAEEVKNGGLSQQYWGQGLLPKLPRPLTLPTGIVHLPESMQYCNELGGSPNRWHNACACQPTPTARRRTLRFTCTGERDSRGHATDDRRSPVSGASV